MMSKSLFFKLQQEDIKRRIWTIALSVLVFFTSFPVIFAMYIGNYSITLTRDELYKELLKFIGLQYPVTLIITIVAAIICGLSGFFFLYSKKKVDLYHSVPVRREVLFAISYINGVLIYLIPYVINVLLCFIVLQTNRFMSMEIFTTALLAIAVNLLFYCLIYAVVILAVMLTGNIIVSCFGTAVFFLYGPMVVMLKEMCFSDFFTTYYGNSRLEATLLLSSPVGIYFDTIHQIVSGVNQGIYLRIIAVLIGTVILTGLGVFLYKKRRSEAAGQAMSFDYSKPVIKFLLVIPLSLGGGIIFREITNSGSNGWFIFGVIFSLIIVYALIEIIYNFDIRCAFNYKKQLLACAGIIAAITCLLQFDLFHYDSYIPSKNKIQSMSVAFSGIDGNLSYVRSVSDSESTRTVYTSNGPSYQLEYMELTDFDSAYALAKLGLQYTYENNDTDNYYNYTVKYTLKNGNEVYRVYTLSTAESYDEMKEVYASLEFKEGHFPIYQWNAEDFSNVSCSNMLDNKEFSLDITEKKQLLELYKEDLGHLTLDELSNSTPLATLIFDITKYNRLDYYVYPSFEKTIAFLKAHGFDATKEVAMKDIKRVVVDNYQAPSDADTSDDASINKTMESSEYRHLSKTYIAEDQIKDIFTRLIEDQYYLSNSTVLNVDTGIEVTVFISADEYGNEKRYSYYFNQGLVPDFVKEDVGYTGK